MSYNLLLLQADPNATNAIANIILFGGIILIMYFFMIRPQMKRAKEQKTYLDTLKKGDKIVTIGGVHGKILKVNEQTLVIEVDKETGTKLKIEKAVVSLEFTQTKTA
ncbi:MAG: preprotein translocase subunit YajC [Chitinophagales bacterium]